LKEEEDDRSKEDEINTKLDLAKAYIEMNDQDVAKNILQEVLSEGNSDQKQQAQNLLNGTDTTRNESVILDLDHNGNDAADNSVPNLHLVSEKEEDDFESTFSFDSMDDLNEFGVDDDMIATKLDLAQAYIEMGDTDSVKKILQEVIDEGNAEQKKQAETLLSSL
jgi:pilus assembly protein FimV